MNPKVDQYLFDGCGRCSLGGTPECKVRHWQDELKQLRKIVLDCGLTEELKWKVPCYTYKGQNILLVSAFKDFACVSFFKGSLLKDTQGILEKPGENSQAVRFMKFTDASRIVKMEATIKAYIFEAIEIEKSGQKVKFKKSPEPIPEELLVMFKVNPELKKAFEALTPGRQRGYILYFSGAKQSATKTKRIEKHLESILTGKGLHD